MRFQDVLQRLTGISCPIFGVSWEPVEPEIDAARRVIGFLEDRRVLCEIRPRDEVEHCVQSVLMIRSKLTQELGELSDKSRLAEQLRAMRAACRKFLTTVEQQGVSVAAQRGSLDPSQGVAFNSALGELRGTFGIHVAQIAALHGLDVEPGLAAILPDEAVPMEDEDELGYLPRPDWHRDS